MGPVGGLGGDGPVPGVGACMSALWDHTRGGARGGDGLLGDGLLGAPCVVDVLTDTPDLLKVSLKVCRARQHHVCLPSCCEFWLVLIQFLILS